MIIAGVGLRGRFWAIVYVDGRAEAIEIEPGWSGLECLIDHIFCDVNWWTIFSRNQETGIEEIYVALQGDNKLRLLTRVNLT